MDKHDLRVLCCLRQDGRMKLCEMAKRTRIPVSTLYDKIRQYEQESLVRHCALVDFKKLGFHTRATMLVRAPAMQRDRVLEKLIKHINVNAVNRINNGYDYAIDTIFTNMQAAEQFVEHLEVLGCKCSVHYLVDELKQEGFLTDLQLIQLLPSAQKV